MYGWDYCSVGFLLTISQLSLLVQRVDCGLNRVRAATHRFPVQHTGLELQLYNVGYSMGATVCQRGTKPSLPGVGLITVPVTG